MASSKRVDFDRSKNFKFSVRNAMKWFRTHPYQHITVFSKGKKAYYENIDANDPSFFTRLTDNVEDGSKQFNYSVGNAIRELQAGLSGRFLIYSKRTGKYYVNKRDDSDGFIELTFLEPSEETKADAQNNAGGGGETKGPAAANSGGATKANAAAAFAAVPVIETDPCKLSTIDPATCPAQYLNADTLPCARREALKLHPDKNESCTECALEKFRRWKGRCPDKFGGRRKTKKKRKRKHRRTKRRKRKRRKTKRHRRRRSRKR